MIEQASDILTVQTSGRALIEITRDIVTWVRRSGVVSGLLTVQIRHTSASLLIQENADPDVRADFERFFRRLVPDGDPILEHTSEGPDDMPSHIRAALTATSLSLPIIDGAPSLGTWQGIYLWEHRTHAHRREIAVHVIGERDAGHRPSPRGRDA